MSLMSYSGGLLYHWRARRHAGGLWTSHREGVRHWLEAWRPRARHLVLIGPSGGYSLPAEWLARFETITVVDPDPVARLLWRFNWRPAGRSSPGTPKLFPHSPVRTLSRSDLLAGGGAAGARVGSEDGWRPLREFVATRPDHAILFCNVLGQLEFLLERSDAEARNYFKGMENALAGSEWGSYHDRVSGPLAPHGAPRSDRALTNEELLARFSPGGKDAVLADHSTGQLAPACPRTYWVWELTPGRYHLIEGIYLSPTT
jgi:hypothetical protein